jgi:DNA-binding response OmpR family regulator
MRALVVEDDKNRFLYRQGLKEAGLSVDHAVNGGERLERALKHSYDAAVIDLLLCQPRNKADRQFD